MDIQKINWKIFIADPAAVRPDDFFKVFNTWIPDSPEIFVDVADYQHVEDGPLTALVGHHADFWLDGTGRRLGLLYNRRQLMDGDNAAKLSETLRALLTGCRRLERAAEFSGKLKFVPTELLFLINDRAVAPNTPDTFQSVKADLEKISGVLYGAGAFQIEHLADPRRRFSARITAASPQKLDSLISRLGG